MGKLNNALRMLAILRSRNKVTRKELAQELEVNEREITRYKDDLEQAGVRIKNITGKYGGYVLEHKDYLLNLELSDNEEDALVNAIKYLEGRGLPYYNDLKSAIDKIKSISPEKNLSSELICEETGNYIKEPRSKVLYSEEREKWLVINDGIINNRKIEIEYIGGSGKLSTRIIHPYSFVTYYSATYLIGLCESKQALRTFKLMRIKSIKLSGEKFEDESFDIKDYLDKSIGLFKDEVIEIKLKISYPYAQSLKEVQRIQDEEIEDYIKEGYIIYKAKVEGKIDILSWILGMGKNCEIIEPVSLIKDLKEEMKIMLTQY